MEQAKQINTRLHVRVTLNEDKSIRRELMRGEYKIADVSKTDIIEMVLNFTSTLRYD